MANRFADQRYTALCSERTLQTNQNGFFMNLVKLISDNAGPNWINNDFGKLKSDRDRIRIVYSHERVKAPLTDVLSNVEKVYRKKDAEIAQGRRMQADYHYLEEDFQKSLILYSQSLLRSPKTDLNKTFDNGKTLALALWGRSKALMQLRDYSYALTDIQQALKEQLPDDLKAEAYWKMAVCYKALGDENKANISFNLAEKLLTDKHKLLGLELDRSSTFIDSRQKKRKAPPTIPGAKNKHHPNASKKISVNHNTSMGRYIVASSPIQTGETLVVEEPYAACLLPDKFGTHCHHCLERLVAPVGCPDCSNVAFCTPACRNSAIDTYHKFECKYLDLLIGSGMSILAHTALRMVTQQSLQRCLDIHRNRSKQKVYSLCTNAQKRTAEDFLQRTLMAAFLLRCLQKSGYFGNKKIDNVEPSEEEFAVGELLLFHLQVLQFNAHEIFETAVCRGHYLKGSRAVYIGVAIYPTVSLFNHDCNPGVTRHFVGKHIVIKASRPLKQGDTVAENYGPIFARKALQERQRYLSSRYWFNCRCEACLHNWPTLEGGLEDVSKRVSCPTEKCNYFFSVSATNTSLNCPKCKKAVSLSDQKNQLKWCEDQYNVAFEKMNEESREEALEILKEVIDRFYSVSSPPHRETYLAQECLQVCEASFGNVSETLVKKPQEYKIN